MVRREREGCVVPESCTGSTKLFLAEVLESDDVVLISNLVHLGVSEELLGWTVHRWLCAFLTDETLIVASALLVACMMGAYDPFVAVAFDRSTRMREFVAVCCPIVRAACLGLEDNERVVPNQWVVLRLVEILDEQFDDVRFVFWQIDCPIL